MNNCDRITVVFVALVAVLAACVYAWSNTETVNRLCREQDEMKSHLIAAQEHIEALRFAHNSITNAPFCSGLTRDTAPGANSRNALVVFRQD